jgi:nicotinate-nucleotide adenylyltransferase
VKLGVFGGTFDPPHVGHLIAAQEVHRQLELDRVLLVPAGVPPHKRGETITPGHIRMAMVRAATAADQCMEPSPIELERDGPSYTVDTLRALHERYPDAELHLAIGADQIEDLPQWKEPEEIARLARLVAFARGGQPPPESPWPVTIVEVPTTEISSTEIRRRVATGAPIRYFVPEPVRQIIAREGLYR